MARVGSGSDVAGAACDDVHGGAIWPARPLRNAALVLAFLRRRRPARCGGAGAAAVLGDSLAAGYGLAAADGFQGQLAAALRARGHDVMLVDAAVSGDTAAGGRARLDWALGGGADAALVELGANDGLRGTRPAEHGGEPLRHPRRPGRAAIRRAAVRHARAAQSRRGLRNGVPRRVRPPGRAAGILYDPFFLAGVARDPGLNQADGIHPNAEGVRREVARLLPLVEQLLAEVKS